MLKVGTASNASVYIRTMVLCIVTTSVDILPTRYMCCTNSVVGTPSCISAINVQSRTDTTITFTWTVPAPGLNYNILLCTEDNSQCFNQVTCTDCSSYVATGLLPNVNYTITVDSVSPLSSGDCISQGCTSNSATAQTGRV